MASPDWTSIYWYAFDREELRQEIVDLKAQAKRGAGLFSSQSEGGMSHTKDLAELRNKLASAVRVWTRKYGGGVDPYAQGSGVADFSGMGEIS